MRITHVEYKRTANLGNFENASLSATAQVVEGEEPDAALRDLRDWVELALAHAADLALERRAELDMQRGVSERFIEKHAREQVTP